MKLQFLRKYRYFYFFNTDQARKLLNSYFIDNFSYRTNIGCCSMSISLFQLISNKKLLSYFVGLVFNSVISFEKVLVCTSLKALCTLFFIKFLFFRQMISLQKLWKMCFISSIKLFLFLRYLNFCNFFPYFPHFPDSKGQIEVE